MRIADLFSNDSGSTLNPQHLGVLRNPRVIFRHASEVCIVLGPQIVNSKHGLVLSDVGDADTTSLGLRQEQLIMSIPFECQREVAVRHRAQHRNPLSQTQMLTHGELIDGGWNYVTMAKNVVVQLCWPFSIISSEYGPTRAFFFLAPNTANKWLLMSLHCWLSL